jgi:uncharacterized phage protein (TIGR01671 family)
MARLTGGEIMRQITFRAKRKDNGQWVHGYYFKTPLTDEATGSKHEDGWFFLTGRERHVISQNGCVYEIDPETLGQETGLCDVNGFLIFEGDIISDSRVVWDTNIASFVLIDEKGWNAGMLYHMASICEVTGNIYGGDAECLN